MGMRHAMQSPHEFCELTASPHTKILHFCNTQKLFLHESSFQRGEVSVKTQ